MRPQAPGAGLRPFGVNRLGAGPVAPPWVSDCKSATRSRSQPGARGALSRANWGQARIIVLLQGYPIDIKLNGAGAGIFLVREGSLCDRRLTLVPGG
jgi:hypothetical protein